MTRPRLTNRVLAGLEILYANCRLFGDADEWSKLTRRGQVNLGTAQVWLLQYRKYANQQTAARKSATPGTMFDGPPNP